MSTVEPHRIVLHSIPNTKEFDASAIFPTRAVLLSVRVWRLPYSVYCAMLVFVIFLCVVAGLVFGTRNIATEPVDPLITYDKISPEYPETVLAAQDCRTQATRPNYDEMRWCEIKPDDPMIRSIAVGIYDGTIQGVFYTFNDLSYGYLEIWWGPPEFIRIRDGNLVAKWASGLYAHGRMTGDFSYTAAVYKMSFV